MIGRACRQAQALHNAERIRIRAGRIVGRRHIGQQAKALGAQHRNRPQGAGLQVAQRRRQHAERNRHVIAEQIVHHLPGALVRDDAGLYAVIDLNNSA